MYADHETRISRRYLDQVLAVAQDPVWIIGGWGVWYAVNEQFRKATGREYAFSRDIDLGFHVDPSWGRKELASSSLARTLTELKRLKFHGQGFRMFKQYHIDSGEPLSDEEAARLPGHMVFPLYVDLMVDHQHPLAQEVLGFVQADEPQLVTISGKGETRVLKGVNPRLSLPSDRDLLAMKIAALPGRPAERDDKRIKDMADIFALLAYGKTKTTDLLAGVRKTKAADTARQLVTKTPAPELDRAAAVAATTPRELQAMLLRLGF